MKLHRDLGISQPAAWHVAHRIRQMWDNQADLLAGPVEIDETYIEWPGRRWPGVPAN